MQTKIKLLLMTVLSLPAFGAYTQVRPVVIPAARVTADLSSYALLVRGTYPYLATVANGGVLQNSNGYDAGFFSDSGCTAPLNFERPEWSGVTGKVEFHVEVPTVSHTANTTIYLCYGNASIVSPLFSSPWDLAYLGVWHLPDGTTLSANDSTASANNGTITGATAGRGQIGGGALLNGSTAHIGMGQRTSLQSPTTALTFSAWVNTQNLSPQVVSPIAAQGYSSPNGPPWWSYYLANNDPSCPANTFAAAWSVGTTLHVICSRSSWFPGRWYYLTFTFDGTTGTLYVDGQNEASAVNAGTLAYGNGTFNIGSNPDPNQFFNGAIDEVRVSNVVRPLAQIQATYNNQLDPGSFYTIGSPLSNSSNFSNVSVVGTTNTQAQVRFTYSGGNVGSCTVAASRDSSLYPLAKDVDPGLFTSANLVSRDTSNLINGNTAQILIGERYKAFTANDGTGSRYSRALKQNATYYYSLTCNGDVFSGALNTRPIAMGDTHLDGIPVNPSSPGKPMWPSPVGLQRCNTNDLVCSNKGRDTEYIDPQTGLLIKHLVMPPDSTIADTNVKVPDGWAMGSGWTIPSGWGNSTTLQATVTASTAPIVLGSWENSPGVGFSNAFGSGDVITVSHDYHFPAMLQYTITANVGNGACTAGNTNPDCAMSVCVTTDWQHCNDNSQLYTTYLTTTPAAYTFGSGQIYDVMQKAGKRIWTQAETGWRPGQVTCTGTNTVTRIWDNGVIPPDQDPPGSYLFIQGLGIQQIISNIDSLHFTITPTCPAGTWSIGGSAFGILTWKQTNSADTLTLSNPVINDISGGDYDPGYFSGFYGAQNQVTLANGDPGGLVALKQGGYSVDLLNGKVQPYMPISPQANVSAASQSSSLDQNGVYWTMGSDRSLVKWVYAGDYGLPLNRSGDSSVPLWQSNMGSVLQTCSATVTTQCFSSGTPITQPGQTLDVLLTAFDSRYSTDPFGDWRFVAVEMGKLMFDARWSGSPGQNFWGWIIVFDPNTNTNVNGLYGAGCVGSLANPINGCIIAARRCWDAPGTRWLNEKEQGQMLRDGWEATEETINVFGAAGGGPAVANKISSTASVACPLGSGFSTCIQFTVDGDPYDFFGGSTKRVFGTYMVGDQARLGVDDITYPGGPILDQPNIDLLKLVAISGTQLTFACVYGAAHCPAVDVNPQMLWMYSNWPGINYPYSPMVDIIAWNYAADPHGTNANGNTIVWDYSSTNAHGWNGNSILSQGGTGSPRCVANQGCYNNQNFLGTTDAQFAAAMMITGRDNVTGLTAMSSSFAGQQGYNGECGNDNCQTHPDYSKLGNDPISNLGIDIRPFVGIGDMPSASAVSNVTGQLYKVSAYGKIHTKIFDTQATSARYILRNISSPAQGNTIGGSSSDNYKFCVVLIAGECQAGSSAGDVYFNVPYLLMNIAGSVSDSACYFQPSGFAVNSSDNWAINDICIYDAGMETQSGTRYQLDQFDMTGLSEQTFGHLFSPGRLDIFSAIHPVTNITTATYPQWYYFPAQAWDDVFATMLAEAPPPTVDTGRRITFQPVIVPVSMPSGADHYGVEFGYQEYGPDGHGGFECSPNRSNDPCIVVTPTVNETTPFYWETETFTGATSGAIAIPALPEHVLFYRIVGIANGAVSYRGPLQTAVIH